jgi:hypothetical protein
MNNQGVEIRTDIDTNDAACVGLEQTMDQPKGLKLRGGPFERIRDRRFATSFEREHR